MEENETNNEAVQSTEEAVVTEKRSIGQIVLVVTLSLLCVAVLFTVVLQLSQKKGAGEMVEETPVATDDQTPPEPAKEPTYEERLQALQALSEATASSSEPTVSAEERQAALESLSESTAGESDASAPILEERRAALQALSNQ